MQISPITCVKSARKRYRCDWCWELIEPGTAYSKWFTYGENVTARLHPECLDAMYKANLSKDEELPLPGTYRRGCHCGERSEDCKCHAEQPQTGAEEGKGER